MRYYNYSELKKDFPDPCDLIDRENAMQHPNAVFVEAVVGEELDEDGQKDLMVLFDCGVQNDLLWVWINGLSSEESYIDEYYFVPNDEGMKYLNSLEEGKFRQ
jgi:hypothetical protein